MPNNDSNYIQTYNHPHGQVLINEQTLTDIADAIREQRLTDDRFKPAQFAGEIIGINEIEGGEYEGETDLSVEEKDVNFYDYDGTRVYSYGKEEFLGLSSLPDNPSHNNLVAQGWNWSLSDAKDYVQNYGILDVGQLYNTLTGTTQIDIELKEGYLSPTLKIKSGGGDTTDVVVYWGDDTHDFLGLITNSNEGTVLSASHVYNTPGQYTISIETYQNTGSLIFYGDYDAYDDIEYTYLLTDTNESKAQVYRNSIVNIRLGQLIKKITMGGLSACHSLKNVVFSNTTIDLTDAFWNCSSLRTIIFPKNITTSSGLESNFINCYSLKRVIYSKNNININKYGFFQQCYSLQKLCFPNITTIFNDNFKNCYSLKQLIIPNTVSSFGNYCFQNCYSLKTINCYSTTSPTVTSTTFTGLPTYTKIYVPYKWDHSIVQAYKTAQYWSNIADQIYQMPGEDNRIQPTISLSSANYYTTSNINKLNITMSDNATGNIVIENDEDEIYNGTITNGSLTVDFTNINTISHNGAYLTVQVSFLDNDNFKSVTSNTYGLYVFGSQNTFVLSGSNHTCTCYYREGMKWSQFINSDFSKNLTLSNYSASYNNTWKVQNEYGTIVISSVTAWAQWTIPVSSNNTITHTTYTLTDFTCCFEANTQILTPEEAKSIQDIDIGDTIIIQNSSTGERTTTTALKVANIHYPTRTRAIVEFADGKELRYNPYHPIWTIDGYKTLGYYKDLPTLEIGDIVVLQNNTTTTVTNITIEEIPNGDLTTYNLLLAGVDDYYLEDEWGYFANDILVHHGVVHYYDEDEYRARHTNDCVNKALYENFDFDNSTDEEIISFIVELHSQSEDAYNEYMKYYLTAAQYRKFVTLYPEIKRRINEEVSS